MSLTWFSHGDRRCWSVAIEILLFSSLGCYCLASFCLLVDAIHGVAEGVLRRLCACWTLVVLQGPHWGFVGFGVTFPGPLFGAWGYQGKSASG